MKGRRDPKAKKLRELRRDHRVLPLQGDKTLRKAWRRKKAHAVRKVRHHEATALRTASEDPDAVDDAVLAAHARRTRKLTKHGVLSLEQHLAVQKDRGLRFSLLMWKNNEALAATVPSLRGGRRAAKKRASRRTRG